MRESGAAGRRRRIGRPDGAAGVTVREAQGGGLVDLVAGGEGMDRLAAAIARAHAIELPAVGHSAIAGELTFLGRGPRRWQVASDRADGAWIAALAAAAGSAASVVDQSDARRHFDLGGPRAPDALAKGVPLDLHPVHFRVGAVAATTVAQIGVVVRRIGDAEFRIGVARSYAESFLEWLYASAAEFGCDVEV